MYDDYFKLFGRSIRFKGEPEAWNGEDQQPPAEDRKDPRMDDHNGDNSKKKPEAKGPENGCEDVYIDYSRFYDDDEIKEKGGPAEST